MGYFIKFMNTDENFIKLNLFTPWKRGTAVIVGNRSNITIFKQSIEFGQYMLIKLFD